jgi:hypothetical protein
MTPLLRLAVILAVALIVAPSAYGQITLDADFDSGSLCLIASDACDDNGVASSVSGNTVTLVGRDNFNAGDWKWVYFRASGVSGQAVQFRIGDDFTTGGSNLNNHAMVYSYDQQTWHFFDNNQRQSSLGRYSFSNNTAFTQNEVYVAYGLPYPTSRVDDKVAEWDATPYVAPLTSGFGSLVIGQSPGGIDDIGRSIAGQSLYGFQITDSSSTASKQKIVLLGGTHANETVGNWTLEGLVDFLVSDDLRAAQLRQRADFYVYPMSNPDGRYAGMNRTTVQVQDEDPNRVWDSASNYNGQTDIRTIGQSMRFDTGGDVDYFIDFHSTVNKNEVPYHFGYILSPMQSSPFWQAVLDREPELITQGASLVDFTGAKFGRDELGAEVSFTFETQFMPGENTDRYQTLGENFGLAWWDTLVDQGDFNFDGVIDTADYLILAANAETDLAGLSPLDAYAAGDLTGDGRNSIEDFIEFKSTYIALHGSAAFAAMVQGVPEPGALCSFLTTMLLLSAAPYRSNAAAAFTEPFPISGDRRHA